MLSFLDVGDRLRGYDATMREDTYFFRSSCPFCGADSLSAKPFMRSHPAAEELDFGEHKIFYSGYASQRVFFTYYQCLSCSGLFCRTYFTQVQLGELYAHQGENNASVPVACRERTMQDYFSLLQRHSRLDGNFLEIGPDTGLFTRCCRRQGRFEQFWLYEPNVEVHETLRNNMEGTSFTLRESPYVRSDIPPENLSTAVLIHVLDHLLDVKATLDDVRHNLIRGGILFVVTHDVASLLARVMGRRWPPYTLQHPQLYSPTSMRRSLEGHGFEILEIMKCTNYFPMAYLFRSLLAVLGVKIGNMTCSESSGIAIKLGNIATVARKL